MKKPIARRSSKPAQMPRHTGKSASGFRGAIVHSTMWLLDAAKDSPCEPGTTRATNGVTIAKPRQAHLYNERR